jgi:hypothetical protein
MACAKVKRGLRQRPLKVEDFPDIFVREIAPAVEEIRTAVNCNIQAVTDLSALVNSLDTGDVNDGDKGDITVSDGGTNWQIDPGAVTNIELADMVQATLKGRAVGAGTGAPQDLDGNTEAAAVIAGAQVDTTATFTTTGTQAAWAIDTATNSVIRWDGASELTLQGIPAPTAGQNNRVKILNVTSGFSLLLVNESGSATAANRLLVHGTAVPPQGGVDIIYDFTAARWRAYQLEAIPPIRYFDTAYSPVGLWHLEPSTGLVDQSGNGYDLTQIGGDAVTLYHPMFIRPSAVGFDGVKYLQRSALTSALAITGAMSVLGLVRYVALPAGGSSIFLSYSDTGETEATNILYQLRIAGTPTAAGPLIRTEYIHENGAGVNNIVGWSSGLAIGQVGMLGFTRSAASGGMQTVTLYLNAGVGATASVTAATGGTSSAARFRIGTSLNSPTELWIGYMSNVAVYNTELTQAQITERYNYCLAGRGTPAA